MRKMNPIARVSPAKIVIIMTDFVNARIIIVMFVKLDYERGQLFEIAKFCGVAPCTIIFCNGVRNEDELSIFPQITVPVSTPSLCKIINLPIVVNKTDFV
jgi:hypothetical protein